MQLVKREVFITLLYILYLICQKDDKIYFETIFLAECLGPGSEGDKTGNVTESVVEIDQCQRKFENSLRI